MPTAVAGPAVGLSCILNEYVSEIERSHFADTIPRAATASGKGPR